MSVTTLARRSLAPRWAQRARSYTVPATYKNLHIEDPQLDGYPRLPYVSRQYLPAKGWWDPQMRRNYGDILHEQEEVLSMWGPDIPLVAPPSSLRQFIVATIGFATLGYVCYLATPPLTAVRREYPFSGLVQELGGIEENQARREDESEEE
ncbi:hypothetical protein JAAARDRAFT_178979 [Jaapia argillacea MUCL 33604]|uniref:Uncharacterized protein n=1 Tax=Jaapia argillacea MUCL 33604 TaxID=933084 RepID=A0A067PRD0_9AGAM|nr:hypothetical protein JAAARDRAFT_178979 [Jaapia argillacea MUCL 33604]